MCLELTSSMAQTWRGFRLVFTVLFLVVTLSGAESPQNKEDVSKSHAKRVFGEKRRVKGISNFGKVSPNLYRGGQPSRQGFEALSKMGVDIVVDTRGNRAKTEGKVVKHLGMKYVSIPWHCPFPHDEAFARFLKLMKDNPHKKIFVHCRLGDDRTGMMVAAYRMALEDWSAADAMLEMQHFGFNREHHFICPRLASYEESFPKRLQNNIAFKDLR
jgi:tyrosine-protein phosphatase SIW14